MNLNVETLRGLEFLEEKVRNEINNAVQERTDLGLSVPAEVNVQVGYNSGEDILAYVSQNEGCVTLYINVLQGLRDDIEGAMELVKYFDQARHFFNDHEGRVLDCLDDPINTVEDFERSFASEDDLVQYKQGFDVRGISYGMHSMFVIGESARMAKLLGRVVPEIERKVDDFDLSLMRHELDHIDFYSSPWQESYSAICKSIGDLIVDSDHLETLRSLNQQFLQMTSQIIPVIETRACFFDFVKPGEWGNVDFDAVKDQVNKEIFRSYVQHRCFIAFLGTLVMQGQCDGMIDQETTNHLWYWGYGHVGSSKALNYNVTEGNRNMVLKIKDEEIPYWLRQAMFNSWQAVGVIGDAYRDDPSRLLRGNVALGFEEYLDLVGA
tara:strand:- start:703 stop:1842 length:1140 start_codon:yes stop_codon:yes gene_type:complete